MFSQNAIGAERVDKSWKSPKAVVVIGSLVVALLILLYGSVYEYFDAFARAVTADGVAFWPAALTAGACFAAYAWAFLSARLSGWRLTHWYVWMALAALSYTAFTAVLWGPLAFELTGYRHAMRFCLLLGGPAIVFMALHAVERKWGSAAAFGIMVILMPVAITWGVVFLFP